MDEAKVLEIASVLAGLKHYEWSAVKIAVEKKFSSMSSRLELPCIEELERAIKLEV